MAGDDKSRYSRALARLGAVAELLSVAAGEVFALAGLFGAGLGRRARIAIDGRFERLSLLSALPKEPERSQLLAELARRDRLFGERCPRWLDRGDAGFVEIEQGRPELGLAVIATGDRPLERDLEMLRDHTHAGGAVDRAATLLAGLGPIAEVIDRFRPPAHHSWQLAGRADLAALEPLAESLGVRPTQRTLLEDVHPLLGGHGQARVAIRIGPGVVYPELQLGYREVEVERLIRLLVGLEINRDPGDNLGRFFGALGVRDRAPLVELTLAGDGPPRIRIAVELS